MWIYICDYITKRLDGNCTKILRAILNKSWKQHLTKQQLYGHLPFISTTIQIRRKRNDGHCLRSKDKLISDVHLWTSLHGRASVGRLTRTCLQQVYADTRFSLEDLPGAMNDMDELNSQSGKSVLAARIDDDDDNDCVYIYIYIDNIWWISAKE